MSSVIGEITPLLDFVLIERTKSEAKTPGGILLPDNAKQKLNVGKVLAVGPGRKPKTLAEDQYGCAVSVKVGQMVYFSEYSGHEIENRGQKLLLIREDDIFATVTEAK